MSIENDISEARIIINDELSVYSNDIQELARKTLSYSESFEIADVAEMIKAELKKIVG